MPRTCNEVPLPVPGDLAAAWRAAGHWTDEILTNRLVGSGARATDPSIPVVVDGRVRLSGPALTDAALRVASGLHALGVGPGDVVLHRLPNWWETVVLSWATWCLGAVLCPVTPALGARDFGFVLDQTRAAVAVVPGEFRGVDHPAALREAAEHVGWTGPAIVVRGVVRGAVRGVGRGAGWEHLAASKPLERPHAPPADGAAVVLYTSGTTAEPKGAVHTHRSLRYEVDSLVGPHALTADDRVLVPMPLSHVAGLVYGALFPVCLGVRAVLMERWDPGRALRLLERERPTVFLGTPVFVRGMLDHPDFAATDVSSMRLFGLGGAGVSPDTVREAAAAFGDCWCKRSYGSTEVPTMTTGMPDEDRRWSEETDGAAIGAAEVRIVDGEVQCRGPEMFRGYLDPALDDEAFDAGGWFRTGDLGVLSDGHLTISGRAKDIVIRGGENVSAREVEWAIEAHPSVRTAAVVPVPDRLMGERICAFVEAGAGDAPSLDGLRRFLAESGLAHFKAPERLEVRRELPRTPSGKVRKDVLRREVLGREVVT